MTDEKPSLLPLRHDPSPGLERQVQDATGCWHESPEEALCIGLLDLCGCGLSETVFEDIVAWLRHRRDSHAACAAARAANPDAWAIEPGAITFPPDPLKGKPEEYGHLIGYVLTRADLAEHGGSVGGSWPTQAGLDWLDAIDAIDAIPAAPGTTE